MVPSGGQDRPVVAAGEDDRGARGEGRLMDAVAYVHATCRHRVEHPPAELVLADDTARGDREAQSRRAAGHDRGRPADGQPDRPDELLHLAEDRLEGRIEDHDVGVEVAQHEQIEGLIIHAAMLPLARGHPDVRTS